MGCLVGCAFVRTDQDSARQVGGIRNGDIVWEGNFIGIMPREIGGVSKEVLGGKEIDLDGLVKALEDKDRFVAAHVLLTERTGHSIGKRRGRVDPITGKWIGPYDLDFNGLRVDIYADGRVVIPEGQRKELVLKWREWQRNRKR
jgi:hypothetical protein